MAGEQELAGPLVGGLQIVIDGLAGLIAQFKPDRPSRFLLPDGRTIRRVAAGGDILNSDGNDVAAAKLAIDCQFEHGEVAGAALDLELFPDDQTCLGRSGGFARQLAPVLRHSLGRGCRFPLILHGHTPRLGYRGQKHEPPG